MKKGLSLGIIKNKYVMRTMNTVNVYQWLHTNNYLIPATTLASQFPLLGELQYCQIENLLDMYFKDTAPEIFRKMQCEVTTILYMD